MSSSSNTDAPSKQLLLGAELVQLKKKAGRSLPVKKKKEFKPSGSWLEQKQIQSSLDETKALLEEQRVEKQGSLAKAEWNPQFRVAEVTCRVGAQWNTMGHERRGKLLLFPEEALFLLEMNKLQVFFDGVPMSIQQAYTVLLGSYNGCTLNEYRTYAHLVKQGYILLRHSKNVNVTHYEQKIRLHQYTLSQKHSKVKPKSVTNDKGVTSSSEVNKNVEVVDIIEGIPSKTQCTDHRKSNLGAVQGFKKAVNLELGDNSSTSAERRQVHENIRNEECPNSSTLAEGRQVYESIRNDKESLNSSTSTETRHESIRNDKEYSNSSTLVEKKQEHQSIKKENMTDMSLNKETHSRLLASQNDYESIEVEKSDNIKLSSNTYLQNSVVITEERNFYRKTSQSILEVMPVKEEQNNTVKKEETGPPVNVKIANNSAKPNALEAAVVVHSHPNSDIIILDEDELSDTNRHRQLSESSSSDFGSIKCETPHLKASSKRKFVDEAVADRKPVVSDLDNECEILEISTSTKKKPKQSPNKGASRNIIQRFMDTTADMKTETKFDLANFQSNGLDWNQPSSSNIDANNIGKHRITNVQLSDTEIEIVPGVIDKVQEKNLVKQESSNDIEIIDLDDDDKDVKTPLSKKEEKMRILDSLPSVEGKFLIHVKAPPQDLLPPNVTPQKKDYYIQLWRLNAAGIGGRPRTAENGEQNINQGEELELQSETRINPWIAKPPEQNRGNRQSEHNTWGTNVHQGANLFINQNFPASPFNMFQAVWQQFASFFPFMNNPMWNVNSFGMQLPWLQPQMNMWRPPWQNRGRPPWRRPYRGRARGRFRPQYHRYPVKDHVSSSDAETETRNVESNESNGAIPFKLENNSTVERNNHPESKLDVVKIKPPNDSEENAELVILDDDDDDEPVAISPSASKFIRQREGRDKQTMKKRGASDHNRYFKPPKKLRGLMEKLLSETNMEQMVKQEGEEEDEKEDVQNAVADNMTERKSLKLGGMKNWKDLKETVSHVMQEIVLDSASSEEETDEEIDVTSDPEPCENQISSLVQPEDCISIGKNKVYSTLRDPEPCENQINSLVQPEDCISIGTVLSKLQIISSVNVQEDNFCASEKIQKINFDVYLPNTPFRKASPGLPKYRIAVLSFQDNVPPLGELAKMMRQFQDDVPLVFAVVIPDSVTFFQVGSVSLPVEVTFPDII